MNLKKKFVVGAASVALIASMGGVAAPAAVAVDSIDLTIPGFANSLNRLGGMDRVQTSLEVAKHEFGNRAGGMKPKILYIVSGSDANMADAAVAGMLQDGPIAVVTNNTYVGTAVGKFFKDTANNGAGFTDLKQVVAIGGESAITDATLQAVKAGLGVKDSSRIGGKDRYETSVAVADRIYTQALKTEDVYVDRVNRNIVTKANLNVLYFANGANAHLVDSEVAGTLDNGPVVFIKEDGSIPDVVAEFIKKTLPLQFAALGGTAAVPDASVQQAWLIKALANKWETSPSIPNLSRRVDELTRNVEGTGAKNDRRIGSPNYMGLRGVKGLYKQVQSSWDASRAEKLAYIQNHLPGLGTTFAQVKAALEGAQYRPGNPAETVPDKVLAAFLDLYGVDLIDADALAGWGGVWNYNQGNINTGMNSPFHAYVNTHAIDGSTADKDTQGVNVGNAWDAEGFEGRADFQRYIARAEEILNRIWQARTQDEIARIWAEVGAARLGSVDYAAAGIARASQNDVQNSWQLGNYTSDWSADWANGGLDAAGRRMHDAWIPMAAVKYVAADSYTMASKWLTDSEAELAKLNQQLSLELDKIAPKTELRLGGADRFETAQLIANQYGKIYGGVVMPLPADVARPMTESYIANGYRLVDALVAGQLSHGPIMLVKGNEKTAADLPKFTLDVAHNLQCWTAARSLAVFGIGGTAVLTDDSLRAVVAAINTQSVCPGERPQPQPAVGIHFYDAANAIIPNPVVRFADAADGAGDAQQLTVRMDDGTAVNAANGATLLWLSNAPGLAAAITADNTITVTPTAANTTPGTYTLRVIQNGKFADVRIRVLANMTAVTVARDNANVNETQTVTFTCTPTPANATGNLTYAWTFDAAANVAVNAAPQAGQFTIAAAPGNVNTITLRAPNGNAAVNIPANSVHCAITQPADGRTDTTETTLNAGNADAVAYAHS